MPSLCVSIDVAREYHDMVLKLYVFGSIRDVHRRNLPLRREAPNASVGTPVVSSESSDTPVFASESSGTSVVSPISPGSTGTSVAVGSSGLVSTCKSCGLWFTPAILAGPSVVTVVIGSGSKL